MKRGEVAMAEVRSISHTHPQTDSTDHASERSVSACVQKNQNRRALQIPPRVSKRSLQTQTLVYIQSRIFKSVPKNNRFDVLERLPTLFEHAKFSKALLKFTEGKKEMWETD